MRVINHNYSTLDELAASLDISRLDPTKSILQVFSGPCLPQQVEKIQGLIREQNPDLVFIGTTTAGEIFNGRTAQNSITVSILEFEHTVFSSAYINDDDDFTLGVKLATTLFRDNTKAMILFIDGLLTNGNDVVSGIASINNTIPIAGGMAGDNGAFKETIVFDRDGIYKKGAVALAMHSDVLKVFTQYQLNWQPIGKYMTVTKAEKNRLYEIDHIPASEIYRKYLGDRIGDGLPHSAIEFPMLKIEEDGMEVCRTFVHKFDEDGSLLTIGNLQEGDQIRLAFGNVDSILTSARNDVEQYTFFQPQAIFTYSCASRITFLQSEVVRELEPLNNIAPIAGFFTYGEIYHQGTKNSLLNISLTILGLSEDHTGSTISRQRSDKQPSDEKNFFKDKHFMVLDALTHLSNVVIDELNESKKEIEEAHKNIKDSINYASIIQNAILPDASELLSKYTQDNFVFWKPKDTVGGDIYFSHELISQEEIILMIIDCTGHGVPGAFVTMLVKAVEKQVSFEVNVGTLEPSPSAILAYFNKQIKNLLRQNTIEASSNAGFDGGVIYYNKRTRQLKFAGAETPLFYVDTEGEMHTVKGNRYSVGYKKCDADHQYKEFTIDAKPGMKFYCTTDGFLDQCGGEKNFPFGKKRFCNIIKQNHHKSMPEQKEILIGEMMAYQAAIEHNDRNDDMTVIGFKI